MNAQFLCALAVHESAWGKSKIARDKNNLFGFGAADRAPFRLAKRFNSKQECIDFVASYIKKNYLTPKGKYFRGFTLLDINKNYCSDRRWAEKIACIMERFETYKISQSIPQIQQSKKDQVQQRKSKKMEVNQMKTSNGILIDWTVSFVNNYPIVKWIALALVIIAVLRVIAVFGKRYWLLALTAIPVAVLKGLFNASKEFLSVFVESLGDDKDEFKKIRHLNKKYKKLMKKEVLDKPEGHI